MNATRRKLLALLVGSPFLIHAVDHGLSVVLMTGPLSDAIFNAFGLTASLWWHFLTQVSGIAAGILLWRGLRA